jgi:hypothetical protein
MYLIYTDETGSSFNKEMDGSFRDGPFFIYGGLSIDINKYEEIENSFKDLCKYFLHIDNVFRTEIHASDIFYKQGCYKNLSSTEVLLFYDEVLQLMAKFYVRMNIGITDKNANIFNNDAERSAASIHGFFYTLDQFLSEEGRRGLIIADELEEFRLKEQTKSDYFVFLSDNKNLFGKKGGLNLSVILRRIFYERINRFTEVSIPPIIKLKYKYESKMYFILDNIHYVDSKLSIYTQLTDINLFIINILFEVYCAEIYGANISPSKRELISGIENSLKGYFYSCVSIAYITKNGEFYDAMYNHIHNNPFLYQNFSNIIKQIITAIKKSQIQ